MTDIWQPSPDVPVVVRETRTPAKLEHVSADLARLKAALDAIPNSGDKELSYDEWRNIIFGIHYACEGSDEGLALAHDFSSKSGKHDREFLDSRVWPYVRSERDGGAITDRTIYALAAQNGWDDPELLDAFEDVADGDGTRPTERAPGRFALVSASAFADCETQTGWHVKGVIPQSELIVVYGESGSGKSFWVLDVCLAVAENQQWRGRKVAPCNVVYIAAEGSAGFRRRLRAYREYQGRDLPGNFHVLPAQPRFVDGDDIRGLVPVLQSARPGIVVVDTLSRVLAGADENSNEDMGQVVAHCAVIHKVTGATVLLVHHSGKDAARGARGWSGLRAAADTEIEITRHDEDRVATVTKQKDGEDGMEFGFRLNVVTLGKDSDGDDITSCVVLPGEAMSKGQRGREAKGGKERIVVAAVRDLMGLAGEPPTANEVIEAAVNQLIHDPTKRDTRRQSVLRAIENLQLRGSLVNEGGKLSLAE